MKKRALDNIPKGAILINNERGKRPLQNPREDIMKFRSKDEAVRYMVDHDFNCVDAELAKRAIEPDWDYFHAESPDPQLDNTWPMWGYVFEPRGTVADFVLANREAVKGCGFSILEFYDGSGDIDYLWLGIDAAGYDFFEAHWEPLYDIIGHCYDYLIED